MPKPIKGLEGIRFGRLVAVSLCTTRTKRGGAIWECKCNCGNTVKVSSLHLGSGDTKSCGCLQKKRAHETQWKHGHTNLDGNGLHSPEYVCWTNLKQRCYDPINNRYKYYGARGIEVCDRWLYSFKAFYEDMGPRPKGTCIHRKDNEKGYDSNNCIWKNRFQHLSEHKKGGENKWIYNNYMSGVSILQPEFKRAGQADLGR